MNIAICYNRAPAVPRRGENMDHISEAGAENEAEAVAEAIRQLGQRAVLLPVEESIAPFVAQLHALRPELVFNLCEGFWGESSCEPHLAALFELLGLSYTGSPPLSLAMSQDKALTKDLLSRHGLPTPAYLLLSPGELPPEEFPLRWPVIVKPACEDASLGITAESVVSESCGLQDRVRYIHTQYRQAALVEEYIDGREFNVAVLGDRYLETLPIAEIRFHAGLPRAIVSYSGKWLEDSVDYVATEPVCPALLAPREQEAIQRVALQACQLLGCRDYARVDIRLRDGIPYILEVNANPDISPDAGLARAAQVGGLDYPALIERIMTLTLERKERCHA